MIRINLDVSQSAGTGQIKGLGTVATLLFHTDGTSRMTSKQLVLVGLGLGLGFSMMTMAHPEKDAAIVLVPATLTLSVGADGSPGNVACKPEVMQALCSLLVKAVSGWMFVPGQREGVPTPMNVALTLNLVAVPKPGGYGVQATKSSLGLAAPLADASVDPETRLLNPPKYPVEFMRSRQSGTVVLELWLQPDSDLPRIGQTWFDGKPDVRNHFVDASTAAAKKWKLNRGVPEQLSTCVPVAFTTDAPGGGPTIHTDACKPTYAAGFAPPTLITKVETASF